MGKKYFMRPTERLEDKLEELRAEVAKLHEQQRTAIYSPPEVVTSTVVAIPEKVEAPAIEEEEVELLEIEEDAVFIPSARATQGSADLKTVESKKGRFEIKNVETLKNKKG